MKRIISAVDEFPITEDVIESDWAWRGQRWRSRTSREEPEEDLTHSLVSFGSASFLLAMGPRFNCMKRREGWEADFSWAAVMCWVLGMPRAPSPRSPMRRELLAPFPRGGHRLKVGHGLSLAILPESGRI